MDKNKLLQYIDHFNHKRYEQVMEFYHPDVLIEYPTMLADPKAPPVTRRGREGFLEQYVELHKSCREALEVQTVVHARRHDRRRDVYRISLLQGLRKFLTPLHEGRRRLHHHELVHLQSRKREIQTHPRSPLPPPRSQDRPPVTMSRLPFLEWALAGTLILSFLPVKCSAQTAGSPDTQDNEVVLTRLSSPIYPVIALTARVTGDVDLMLGIRRDGSVESAVVVGLPSLLQQAALNSAKQSQYECRNCIESVTQLRLVYTFQIVVMPVSCAGPQDCNRSYPDPPGPVVTQTPNHVTIVNHVIPLCICDSVRKRRSLKCLYLWRCGLG